MTLDLTQPAEQIATLVAGVTDDQLDAPTPCPEMTVGTLLAHLAALAQAFTDAAAKVTGPTTSTPPTAAVPVLPDDWRTVIPARLEALVAAWQQPEVWQGETTVGGVTMPADRHRLRGEQRAGAARVGPVVGDGSAVRGGRAEPGRVLGDGLQHPRRSGGPGWPVRAAAAGRRECSAAGPGPGRRRSRSVLVAGGLRLGDGQRPAGTSHTCVVLVATVLLLLVTACAAPAPDPTGPEPTSAPPTAGTPAPARLRQSHRKRSPPTGSSPAQTSAAPSSTTPSVGHPEFDRHTVRVDHPRRRHLRRRTQPPRDHRARPRRRPDLPPAHAGGRLHAGRPDRT